MNNPIRLILAVVMLVTQACATPLPVATQASRSDMTTAAAPIHFFRHYLSGADGQRCPMTPSCSRYALSAMARHGAFMGWVMACDRLMRCGRDELKHSSSVMTPTGIRCRDTVDNNDFWWH